MIASDAIKYQVSISGTAAAGCNLGQVKGAFAELFQLSLEQATDFLDGNSRVLQTGLDEARAREYAYALHNIGLEPLLAVQPDEDHCPLCGGERARDQDECDDCGLLIDEYQRTIDSAMLVAGEEPTGIAGLERALLMCTATLALLVTRWDWF